MKHYSFGFRIFATIVSASFSFSHQSTVAAEQRPNAPAESSVSQPELRVERGHVMGIRAMAVSRDGRYLATGSEDKSACLWNAKTGQKLHCFSLAEQVSGVDLTLDGFLLTLTDFSTPNLTLWNLKTLKPEKPGSSLESEELGSPLAGMMAQGPQGLVDAAALSPDGRALLVVGAIGINLVDVVTGDVIREFDYDNYVVNGAAVSPAASPFHLAFSADGRFAVGGGGFGSDSKEGIVWVWDVASGKRLATFPAHKGMITSVAFSPDRDATYIVTGSQDGSARKWQWRTRKLVYSLRHEKPDYYDDYPPINAVAISPNGLYLVTGSWGSANLARLWDFKTGKFLRPFTGHDGGMGRAITAAVFSQDSQYVYTADNVDTARMWDIASATEQRRFSGIVEALHAVVFTNNDQTLITSGDDNVAHLWNLNEGKEFYRTPKHENSVQSVASSSDGRYVITGSVSEAVLWDVKTNNRVWSWDRQDAQDGLILSVSYCSGLGGPIVAVGGINIHPRLWYLDSKNNIPKAFIGRPQTSKGWASHIALSKNCEVLVAGYSLGDEYLPIPESSYSEDLGGEHISAWHLPSGLEFPRLIGADKWIVNKIAVSDNGEFVVAGRDTGEVERWRLADGQRQRNLPEQDIVVTGLAISGNGEFVVTGGQGGIARRFKSQSGDERSELKIGSIIIATAITHTGKLVAIAGQDRITRLWNAETNQELASLVSFTDGTWMVATPDGRFDTNNLEEIKGLRWIMPDDPLRPLPLEIFMRDYYEPRLLPRVLAGEKLPPIPSLAELNRAQPKVEIKEVRVEDAIAGLVAITVEVANDTLEVVRGSTPLVMQSGAYDLRLFRDGQLVAQFPEPKEATNPGKQTREEELAQWRGRHQIKLDPKTGKMTHTFPPIRLPRKAGLKEVEFSAYAFNIDRVKSDTERATLEVPKELIPRQARAYVVTIGVNGFEHNAMSRLRYAANDAKGLSAELSNRLKNVKDPETGRFIFGDTHVVPITLVTEFGTGDQADKLVTNYATKDRIKAVIEKLAGKPVDAVRLRGIANADQLMPAQPEDLVLIGFSTHGDTRRGQFYLMPYDLGTSPEEADILKRAISSEELSAWLRTLDAGELVMIVDACHSAATVESQEFKPGPMGSRGLGQLAFDKGMRILAASQRDRPAYETEKRQHGLLSDALVTEGLIGNAADFKPKDTRIQLSEWLNYGVDRVPELYREDKLKARTATPLDEPEGHFISIQQPALFDFARGRDIPLVVDILQ